METTQASLDHLTRENPMGEARKDALRLNFDHKLKLEFHGTKVTSDAGLLAYRELDEALGLTSAIDSELRDNRTGKNTRHSIAASLRQSIYSRLAGYDDTNPAVAFFDNTCEAGMMCGTVETRFLEWRATVAVCQNSGKRWLERPTRPQSSG